MPKLETMADAESEARRRFVEHAEALREELENRFFDALPGNHTPTHAIMLAHLMTATDGYNYVQFGVNWETRPQTGWATTLIFLADIGRSQLVPFAFEVRNDNHFRRLAITIDENRPGERLPEKLRRENDLIAQEFRVVSFTELEILSNPEDCRSRVEVILSEMADDVLVDAGAIRGWHGGA